MSGAGLPSLIIPVHNAPDVLDRCLESVCATVPDGAEVIVIDDASTDGEVASVLHRWQQRVGPSWQFHFQKQNLGFVATVNRGMKMTQRDIVLLNSDTEVTPGWLEGLQRCLASDPLIATATPWTNNGEIASIPGFCEANPPPRHPESVARVIAGTGTACYPELPTAVGFCMAVSRKALNTLGLFDEKTFGKLRSAGPAPRRTDPGLKISRFAGNSLAGDLPSLPPRRYCAPLAVNSRKVVHLIVVLLAPDGLLPN